MSDAHRAKRRDQIVAAALRCFARQGYQRTSMADIIAEAGLSAGAIYQHFPGKQALIRAVAEHVLDERRTELADLPSRNLDSPGAIVATVLEGLRHEPLITVLPHLWAEATIDQDLREVAQEMFGRVRTVVTEVLADWGRAHPDAIDGDPDAWAALHAPMLLGLIPGFVVQRALFDDFDEDGYRRALAGLSFDPR